MAITKQLYAATYFYYDGDNATSLTHNLNDAINDAESFFTDLIEDPDEGQLDYDYEVNQLNEEAWFEVFYASSGETYMKIYINKVYC